MGAALPKKMALEKGNGSTNVMFCDKRFAGGRRLAPEVLWKGYSAEKKDLCTTGKQV